MSDSFNIQRARSAGISTVGKASAAEQAIETHAPVPASPADDVKVTAPASEKATRLAELELHTSNQRDRLVTAQKTQEFLHHDRESGMSYILVDGTLVQGTFRGGAPSSPAGKVRELLGPNNHPSADAVRDAVRSSSDQAIREGEESSSLQFQRQTLLSDLNQAEQLRSEVSRNKADTDDDLRKNVAG